MKKPPCGVLVATVSPFDAGGRFCPETFRSHLEFLAQAGVQGFVPCGTTGEAPTLSPDEWSAQIKLAREIAGPRELTVVAGAGGNSTAHALDLLLEAGRLGSDAGLVVTPYYNKPTEAGLLAHYFYLADHSKIPLVLYNVPGRTGVSISPALALKLFAHENIVGVKEASGQYGQWLALAESMNLRKKSLLAGDDDALAVIGALGGVGIISASANVIPSYFVAIQNHLKNLEWPEAFRLQKKIAPLVRALFSETNPGPVKYALHRMRGMENRLRLPLVPVGAATEERIASALRQIEAGA